MATTTTAMRVVRGIVGPDAVIYNDPLRNGQRSIKVEYWWQEQRDWAVRAQVQLTAMGRTAKIVTTRGGMLRLHVG